MPVLVEVVLALAALLLVITLTFLMRFFRHPIATTVWLRRKRLQRAGFVKKTIQTSFGSQTVWEGGNGPLLVLLHGAGDQAGTWHKIARDLGQRYSLLIPDLAGHGESSPSSGPLSIATILQGLEELLDSAPWKSQKFILAGNSLGAWIAMLYARKHPERVSRLFLVDGGALENARIEVTLTPKNREEARRAFDAILDPATPRPPSFVLDDLVRVTNHGVMARLTSTAAEMGNYILDGKLGDYPVPVDLVWGASDRLVPLEYARRMEAQLPAARVTVIECCGHAPQLECPEKLQAVLLVLLAADPPQSKKSVTPASTNA